MTTPYTPCPFEHPVNSHLSTCTYKKKCDSQKYYPLMKTPYCLKKIRFNETNRIWNTLKEGLEERARDGEEFHQFNKDLLGDGL